MQIVVNLPMIKQKARFGKIATAVGVVALAIGFIASLGMAAPGQQPDWMVVTGSYLALIVALGALSLGRSHIARWSRRPRPDEVLASALKGFDARYNLLCYMPSVPVEHLLITPHGLVVIVSRHIAGDVRNQDGKWHRKFSVSQFFGGYSDGSLGNPTEDARRSVKSVQRLLDDRLGPAATDVAVSAVIVFTDSRVNLSVENPEVPVVAPDELQNHVRKLNPDIKLPRETTEQVLALFAPDRAQFEAKPEAPREVRRRKRARKPAPLVDQSKQGRNRAERRMR